MVSLNDTFYSLMFSSSSATTTTTTSTTRTTLCTLSIGVIHKWRHHLFSFLDTHTFSPSLTRTFSDNGQFHQPLWNRHSWTSPYSHLKVGPAPHPFGRHHNNNSTHTFSPSLTHTYSEMVKITTLCHFGPSRTVVPFRKFSEISLHSLLISKLCAPHPFGRHHNNNNNNNNLMPIHIAAFK